MDHVRIVGPTRCEDQVELSRTDEIELGIVVPLRESGDLADTPWRRAAVGHSAGVRNARLVLDGCAHLRRRIGWIVIRPT
jgi:propanediol utilization protein